MRTEAEQRTIASIIERLPLRYPQIKQAWHYKGGIVEFICFELKDGRPNYINITGIKGESIEQKVVETVELRCNVCMGVLLKNENVGLGATV